MSATDRVSLLIVAVGFSLSRCKIFHAAASAGRHTNQLFPVMLLQRNAAVSERVNFKPAVVHRCITVGLRPLVVTAFASVRQATARHYNKWIHRTHRITAENIGYSVRCNPLSLWHDNTLLSMIG